MSPQKRARQEGAIERTKKSILVYEEKLKSCKDDTEKKRLMKKIKRAKTTISNTKLI